MEEDRFFQSQAGFDDAADHLVEPAPGQGFVHGDGRKALKGLPDAQPRPGGRQVDGIPRKTRRSPRPRLRLTSKMRASQWAIISR